MSQTLSNFLEDEARLINEAAEALPHQFSSCTYPLGYIRQAVYLCLSCNSPRGICSSCSVACHTDHEQVELFPKRHFRCDCPTGVLPHPCTLHKTPEEENLENMYNHNFKGSFCRCGRVYDANKERETMIQCLACEDWFHESCLNLRERPPSREPTPDATEDAGISGNDTGSETSSGLPPPLISASDYESFICRSCVLKNATLRKWAGTDYALMVTRDKKDAPWKILKRESEDNNIEVVDGVVEVSNSTLSAEQPVGSKRPHEPISGAPEDTPSKRVRVESSGSLIPKERSCTAPQENKRAEEIFSTLLRNSSEAVLGAGDIFLVNGWRDQWCRCDQCFPALEAHPYLLEEEDTYEPPEDPDSTFSLEELGMRALQQLPRDRAIDGIVAFNAMRDGLLQFLRPFAEEGKVVNEEDVRRYFEEKQEAMREARQQSGHER